MNNNMNLKEAFRYQNFLDTLMNEATGLFTMREVHQNKTTIHYYSKVNPDKADERKVEEKEMNVDPMRLFSLIVCLVGEKETLSEAIEKAKNTLSFDMDAAVAANKFRQQLCKAARTALSHVPCKTVNTGRDYKFNAEGNQLPYYYETETSYEDAYDRETVKKILEQTLDVSDKVSNDIDLAKVNTKVDYTPMFSVNSTFTEVLETYSKRYDA